MYVFSMNPLDSSLHFNLLHFCIRMIFCCYKLEGLVKLTFELLAALYEFLHQSCHFWVGCLVVEGRLGKNNIKFTEMPPGTCSQIVTWV